MNPDPSSAAVYNPFLHNPHLDGYTFFWEGGQVGALLIHGLTATTAEVRPLGQILHQRLGYTISGPLLPGHNTRPDDLNRFRWQDWLATVDEAYQNLSQRCQTIIVGGESTGALLALYLASQYPEIACILIYSPALKLIVSRFDLIRLYLIAPFVSSMPKGSLDSPNEWQGYPVNPLKGAIQLLKFQEVVKKRLADIHQPILIVQGRLDTTVHPTAPQTIYDTVKSNVKEIHWMENSSHVVIIDKELDSIAEITIRFIEKSLSQPTKEHG